MAEDAGESDHDESTETVFTGFWLAVKDWRVWFMSLALTAQVGYVPFQMLLNTHSGTPRSSD